MQRETGGLLFICQLPQESSEITETAYTPEEWQRDGCQLPQESSEITETPKWRLGYHTDRRVSSPKNRQRLLKRIGLARIQRVHTVSSPKNRQRLLKQGARHVAFEGHQLSAPPRIVRDY